MADPQAQANGEQESKVAPAKKQVKSKLPKKTSRWRAFWDSRSKARVRGALVLMLLALAAAIYLSLTDNDQAQVVAVIQAVGQALGATGLRVGVVVALALSMGASLALWLSPAPSPITYYSRPTSSVVPNITVLVDTENLANVRECLALLANILGYLHRNLLSSNGNTRRSADLLFFMDAKQLGKEASESLPENKKFWIENIKHLYTVLIFNGFRLINSPHDPSGAKAMNGVVDREIEHVAFERALTSDTKHLFVIMSGDGDFAPLIYNLVAMGHEVQMWTWGKTKVYARIKKGVTNLTVEHFPKSTSNKSKQSQPAPQKTWTFELHEPPANKFADNGESLLYNAIYNTVEGCKEIATVFAESQTRSEKLRGILDKSLNQTLKELGFDRKGSHNAWLQWLTAVDALRSPQKGMYEPGDTPPEQATLQLLRLAREAARAAVSAKLDRNGFTGMVAIITVLIAPAFAGTELQAPLKLLSEGTDDRASNMRFLISCAQALGLMKYEEPLSASGRIKSPMLLGMRE